VYLTGTNMTNRGWVSRSGRFERICRLHGFKAHQECIVANLSEELVFGPVGQSLLIHEVSRSQRRITVGRAPLDE
jgi:hypothetical protein